MAMKFYDDLLPVVGKAINDSVFRDKLLADPNGVLRSNGVDIGKAVIKVDWVESTNMLNIHVANGGANWTGGIILNLEK